MPPIGFSMKLNISVEIDWLDEEGSIDDIVKEEIISGVKNAISKDCLNNVKAQASKAIDLAINNSIASAQKEIEAKAVQFADDWLEKEVTITDKWGDTQDCLTITDLIKKSFDNLLNKKVNDRGEFSDGYGGQTLVKWLTGSRVRQVVAEKLKGINKDIDNQISEAVNAGIRKNVSDKFAEMVVSTARHDANALKQLESKG